MVKVPQRLRFVHVFKAGVFLVEMDLAQQNLRPIIGALELRYHLMIVFGCGFAYKIKIYRKSRADGIACGDAFACKTKG
jgi:hypothetical protein